MPRTALYFEAPPFDENDKEQIDPITQLAFADIEAPVILPASDVENALTRPTMFFNADEAIEWINRRGTHPIYTDDHTFIQDMHPILYPDANFQRYKRAVSKICENLVPGRYRNQFLDEVRNDMEKFTSNFINSLESLPYNRKRTPMRSDEDDRNQIRRFSPGVETIRIPNHRFSPDIDPSDVPSLGWRRT